MLYLDDNWECFNLSLPSAPSKDSNPEYSEEFQVDTNGELSPRVFYTITKYFINIINVNIIIIFHLWCENALYVK